MEFLTNELSIHNQFHDIQTFREALSRLMVMRDTARRFGREVHCHRTLLIVNPMPGVSMQQAIASLTVESERRAAMLWLTRGGPFWDDMRQHGDRDWLECNDEIVTDTAIGESAFRLMHGVDCGLISFSPSDWNFTPLQVTWCRESEGLVARTADVANWWNLASLEEGLRDRPPPFKNWEDVGQASANRFENLRFADDCFAPLEGIPYSRSAAGRLLVLLDILDRLAGAFDEYGERSAEGQQIYQDYFVGNAALFSDSSDSEKRQFRRNLTFSHPEVPRNSIFCTWHGKVRHLTLRLHFSWPIVSDKPTYVVYAGPKLTKR